MNKRAPVSRAAALAALASALLLGGCMSFIPDYERPAAPVPAVYAPELLPAAAASAPGSVPAADIEWQRFFADARLRRTFVGGDQIHAAAKQRGPGQHRQAGGAMRQCVLSHGDPP